MSGEAAVIRAIDRDEQHLIKDWEFLHSVPEIAFEEYKTSAYLAERMREAGFCVETGVGAPTALVCRLEGKGEGPVVAIRADMDALEHLVDGQKVMMHTCGHDAHSAMVLGAARALATSEAEFGGTLKILFQPAEEPVEGALKMLEAGAVDDVDYAISVHVRPRIDEWVMNLYSASPSIEHCARHWIKGVVKGRAAHGSRPHLGVNVIEAMAAITQAICAIRVEPGVSGSAKVTCISAGGTSWNIIPEHGEFIVDIAAQDNDTFEMLKSRVREAIHAGASTVGATAETHDARGVCAAMNDPFMVNLASKVIVDLLGDEGLRPPVHTPGGEDFHWFARLRPNLKSTQIGLGADAEPTIHNTLFHFNKRALAVGAKIMAVMAWRLLNRLA